MDRSKGAELGRQFDRSYLAARHFLIRTNVNLQLGPLRIALDHIHDEGLVSIDRGALARRPPRDRRAVARDQAGAAVAAVASFMSEAPGKLSSVQTRSTPIYSVAIDVVRAPSDGRAELPFSRE
jgi:hypothetical protein